MIMEKLKEATREQHDNLEKTVDVMNQMFDLDDYKTLILKFYRFYSSVEPELAKIELIKYGYDLSARLKTPKLTKDLENLGLREEAEKLPVWKGVPRLDSPEKAFGTLYVIEGATLGGQIINRHLQEQLDLTPEQGGLFFSGYGQKTGEMWKEFIEITNKFALAVNNDREIINSAKATFNSFGKCIQEPISLRKVV